MKKLLFAALAFMSYISMEAEVKLPAIFSDGMVMQQSCDANLWGSATANSPVVITTSWNKKRYKVNADKNGKWKISVKTSSAGGPYNITFDDGKRLTVNNILIGELWLCSGQSNMEMPMKGFKNQPVENAAWDIMRSKNDNIRLFTVKRDASIEPKADVTGTWQTAAPESVREFSATAYYFGRMVNELLDTPVGLVVAAWGGSSCEAWMKSDWLKAFPSAKIPKSEAEITSKNRNPTLLFNAMLSPLIGLTMKGCIWYQGEDNYNRASTYADMFTTMIKGWRNEWNQGDFPFFYCQIAPYDYSIITEKGKEVINSAYLREQQAKAEQMVKNVGMAVLLDAGLEKGIHPSQKKIAGERLARLAMVNTYGMKGVSSQSPYFKDFEVKGDTVIVSFERADMWINCKGKFQSDNFKLAGEDRVFHKAKTWIERSKLYVLSSEVNNPVAVRYAFENYVEGDLFGDDLPISSFRSDNW
ncbi:sialate O-acetylesterase [Phocaeicola paurosaccharolyticus]|uniref:sialate O-acetylesterase n=1 Tax=Phocaeicola paurosaccharolyticus TaxID=732242 RepID=UPI000469AB89|nr:sialate O-acetylesterase [Phocaeicola paurosaccharolyticus]